MIIENAFGLLKQRSLPLVSLNFKTVDKMCHFILSCCVLHNVCLLENDDDPFEDADEIVGGEESPVEWDNSWAPNVDDFSGGVSSTSLK